MSLESVQLFLEKVETDHNFALQVSEFKQVADLVQFAQAAGFDFDMDDFIEGTILPEADWIHILEEVIDKISR